MNWRGLHISRAARLSLKQRQVLLEQEEGKHTFPLEDMAYIILDTQQATLTAALLSACAEAGCLVLCCDARHIPNAALLPYQSFHRHTETLLAQMALSEPWKKQLWKSIVQRKIRNQAACLERAGRPAEEVKKVGAFEARVRSGDADNAEGVAAHAYWKSWVEGFRREQEAEDRLNVMLNYGYALVRAAIARELAARGFSPSLGVHHRSMANAFNLADDILEPWRPFVDELALNIWLSTPEKHEFSTEDRRALARIFHVPLMLDGESMQLIDAVRKQAEQFRMCVMKQREGMPMPSFAE